VNRAIVAFRQDDAGEWVADLSCLHAQHVRHRPPFRLAPWVLDDRQRAARVGTPLDCPLCDRGELPDGLRVVRTTETWDGETMPTALGRAQRVGAGTGEFVNPIWPHRDGVTWPHQ
jgi:tellurite methyltransferase